MKKALFSILLFLCSIGVSAQIPARVTEIMNKVNDVMDIETGSILEMKMSISMLVSMGSVNIKSYQKDNKEYSVIEGSILGKQVKQISGDDGIKHWEFDSLTDSLIITKSEDAEKSEYDLDLSLSKDYKKATLKDKSKYYEITFTDPYDEKETPSRTVIKIRKEDYMFEEMSAKMGPLKMTMTLVNFQKTVPNDKYFVFRQSDFPNAKIEYK